MEAEKETILRLRLRVTDMFLEFLRLVELKTIVEYRRSAKLVSYLRFHLNSHRLSMIFFSNLRCLSSLLPSFTLRLHNPS